MVRNFKAILAKWLFLKKIGPFPASFFFILVFSIQLIVQINFADDWIRTADLWCRKQPLYQLHHNHFPNDYFLLLCCLPSIH